MVVVLGSVVVQDGKMEDALSASHEHVQRSRSEPGCIEHGVSVDAENRNRLIFVERWENMQALTVHFSVPASSAFVMALREVAAGPPSMTLYEASEVNRLAEGGTV